MAGNNQTIIPSRWEQLKEKYRYGLSVNAEKEEKGEYASFVLTRWGYLKEEGRLAKRNSLKDEFQAYFEGFSQQDFTDIDKGYQIDLRSFLRDNGVYVAKRVGLRIAKALYESLETEGNTWPEDDPDRPPPTPAPTPRPTPRLSETATMDGGPPRSLPTSTGMPPSDPAAIPPSGPPPQELSAANPIQGQKTRSTAQPTLTAAAPPPDISRAIANVAKMYTSESEKYSGDTFDDFTEKYDIFTLRCQQMGIIQPKDVVLAMPVMLKDDALFFGMKLRGEPLQECIRKIRRRFEPEERTVALIREWESLTLAKVIADPKNDGKTREQCLDILINKAVRLHTHLPKEYDTENAVRFKLLNAVRDVEYCRLAYQKPAATIAGVIADLRASVSCASETLDAPKAFYTDRHFHRREDDNKRGNFRRDRRPQRCYVCGETGCMSYKHPAKERVAALAKKPAFTKHFTVTARTEGEEDNDAEDANLLEIAEEMEDLDVNLASIDDEDTFSAYIGTLHDNAVVHALSAAIPQRCYGDEVFRGIMLDTGSAKGSTAGKDQYDAYCRFVCQSPRIDATRTAICRFGAGETRSLGVADIQMPIGNVVAMIQCHIVDLDTPFLMCLQDMDRLGIILDNIDNQVVHKASGESMPIHRHKGHPFLRWDPRIHCFFTRLELKRLHRRFGHAQSDKLYNLLQRAKPGEVNAETRAELESIIRHCEACQLYAQKPRRFKFSLRDDVDFNHSVYVDTMFIEGKPVLHVVDEATNYQGARWLLASTADALWRALRMTWVDVYLGPPDVIVHDAGKNYMARAFQDNADFVHVATKAVPVESPQSMTVVERYHEPLRKAYLTLKKDGPPMTTEERLQTAVKAVNDTAGPDGLVPTLLVYGALPRLGLRTDAPAPSIFQRARAVRNAMEEVRKHFARRQVNAALRARNGPDVSDIHAAPLGSQVLVYRDVRQAWEGPFRLVGMDGETCTVETPNGRSSFRTTAVKPFRVEAADADNGAPQGSGENAPRENDDGAPRKNDEIAAHITQKMERRLVVNEAFQDARRKEIQGLLDQGVFAIVPATMAKGNRIYGSRFVDEIKNAGLTSAYAKSRLVVQAFEDKDHGLMTYAPTTQRASQRLLIALTAMNPDLKIFTRDISQAYLQSATRIERAIFLRAPPEMCLDHDHLLQVMRPLYGLPESGIHWFRTYHRHHTEVLGLKASLHDPCMLFFPGSIEIGTYNSDSVEKRKLRGMTCLQTDDTANAGNKAFMEKEEKHSAAFKRKDAKTLEEGGSLEFNGAMIALANGEYSVTVPHHFGRLEEATDKASYAAQRARGAYIAAICRPDLSIVFAKAAQNIDPSEDDIAKLNKAIKRCKAYASMGLRFVPLGGSIRLATFVDSSFADNKDLSSQLGFVVALVDADGNANIIHYSTVKSRRVTRSVLAAELYALAAGFDSAASFRPALNDIVGKEVPLVAYTDSKSLYDALTSINATTEKRLLIDLQVIRQAYEYREITEVAWIPTDQNPADGLTKEKANRALEKLMTENKVELTPNAWVERDVHKEGEEE